MILTVAIPCYRDWNYLTEKTLAPLFAELDRTQAIYEVRVVDDGSPGKYDFTKYPQPGPRGTLYIEWAEHRGACAARNQAWQGGMGLYTLFMDADVTWEPWGIMKMLTAIETKKVDVVYSKFKHGSREIGQPYSQESLLRGNYIGGTGLIRTSSIPKDGWDEELPRLQDWDFWRRAIIRDKAKVHFIDDVLFTAARRKGISSQGSYKQWIDVVRRKENEWDL